METVTMRGKATQTDPDVLFQLQLFALSQNTGSFGAPLLLLWLQSGSLHFIDFTFEKLPDANLMTTLLSFHPR